MTGDVLSKWIGVALSIGHLPLNTAGDVAVMATKHEPRPVNNGAWGIGALMIAILGVFTLGGAWLLFVPYLLLWAIVGARRAVHPRNTVEKYMLSIDADGWPMTDPPHFADELVDAAVAQGRITRERL